MTGPHAIWSLDREGRKPSEAKHRRVATRRTLADLAGETGYSISQLHRLEVGGHGSADLRRRVGQALGFEISPARGLADLRQLELGWGASSS